MTGMIGTFGYYFGSADPLEYGVKVLPSGSLPLGRVYLTVGGERLDQIAQMAYAQQNGALEALLVYNPGLADHGFELPAGIAIALPELTVSEPSQAPSREVALWG